MSSGTFSGPPRERPLGSANARGSAPPSFGSSVSWDCGIGCAVTERRLSVVPRTNNRSLSFSPPLCRRARAGQGRSLPLSGLKPEFVQLRARWWPEASL
jgi:hypothetical protein